jgi:hypothetical protein
MEELNTICTDGGESEKEIRMCKNNTIRSSLVSTREKIAERYYVEEGQYDHKRSSWGFYQHGQRNVLDR